MSALDLFIRGLERIKNAYDTKMHKMLEDLGKFGEEYAKAHVMNIDTGETRDSINHEVKGNRLIISAGGQAIWLEFGTGITYNEDGYPGELPDGVGGIGSYGRGQGGTGEGWYYHTDNFRPNAPTLENATTEITPKAYQLKDGSWIVHTYGIQSNHFMWDTITAVEEKAQEMGLKIIESELKAL